MSDIKTQVEWLREHVARKGPQFETGSTIRWTSGGKYQYAAIFAGGRWWITGNASYYGGNTFSTEEFIEQVLQDPGATEIEIASEWTVIQP